MNSSGIKVLLDSSFILPTLGISVSGANPEIIKVLAETHIEIYYSNFSILESLWVATRISEAKFDAETFQLGLRSIIEGQSYRRVEEDSGVFKEAFNLYRLGQKDMIDNILCATATQMDMILLTLDDELMRFLSDKKLRRPVFLSPDLSELKSLLEKKKTAGKQTK